MAKEFCRNRCHETKPISHLPHKYRFADGSKSLVVDYATTDQLDQCRKMIDEAALRGDNVGVDEYENNGDSIEALLHLSEIFQASDPVSGRIQAFMFIQPCLYQRTYDSCTASVYVFRTKDIDDEVYAELMSLVADFAKDIDTGYTQCFTQVALCLHGIYLQLRKRGFLTFAILPNWISIAGDNLKDNAIMVKDFGMPERPARSSEDVLRMCDRHFTPERVLKEYTNADIPQIPGLPKIFLHESGNRLVLRNARKSEDHLLYGMFVDAEKKGDGYSVHEFPSLNTFRLDILSNGYAAAIEEEKSAKLIGFLLFKDSENSRSGQFKVCEESIVVSAELRGQGYGTSLTLMTRFLNTSLGYDRMLRNTFFNNNRALNLCKIDGFTVCGVLPRGAFKKGVGWIDLIISVDEIDKKPNNHANEDTKSRL